MPQEPGMVSQTCKTCASPAPFPMQPSGSNHCDVAQAVLPLSSQTTQDEVA